MAQSGFRQDMPPPGGYANIPYQRVPIRTIIKGKGLFPALIAVTGLGIYMVNDDLQQKRKRKVEEYDVSIALEPLITAERDRLFLLQLIKNREDEEKLMKNIPGWKSGLSVDGEPIYKSVPEDYYVKPFMDEYYAHANHWRLIHSRFYSNINN